MNNPDLTQENPVKILTLSAVLGSVALAIVAQWPSSAAPVATNILPVGGAVSVLGIPGPAQLMYLTQADLPFAVPASHAVVVTGCGVRGGVGDSFAFVDISLDGNPWFSAPLNDTMGTANFRLPYLNLQPGVVANEGQIIDATVTYGTSEIFLNAYLQRN